MTTEDIWNFERCREHLTSLRGRLGFPDSHNLAFLRLHLDPGSGILTTEPDGSPVPGLRPLVFCVLETYSRAMEIPETSVLVAFGSLPGGHAYDVAFRKRAVLPLASLYSRDPGKFQKTMNAFGGIPVRHADYAWKVHALPRVPIYILIWEGSDEFPASSALLFDASVSAALETEAVAMLGELLTQRIAFFLEEQE